MAVEGAGGPAGPAHAAAGRWRSVCSQFAHSFATPGLTCLPPSLASMYTHTQAQQRDAELTAAAATDASHAAAMASNSGFEALALGQEDAHVCGTALPLTWVDRVPRGHGAGGAGGRASGAASAPAASSARLPPPAPRFLRMKVTDGKVSIGSD